MTAIDTKAVSSAIDRLPVLDGIRGVAALMVMVFHWATLHTIGGMIGRLAVVGQTGVDLFFVLSGFLITRILLVTKHGERYFLSFYARRALRIFPLYYGFLAVYFLVLPALGVTRSASWQQQIWSWLYLQNLPMTFSSLQSAGPAHFWSLAVEEHFYLVWPLLVLLLRNKHLVWLLILVLAVCPLLRLVLSSYHISVFYLTPARMDGLGFGALLAVSPSAYPAEFERFSAHFARLLALFGAFLLILFLIFSGNAPSWLLAVKFSIIPAAYACLLGTVAFLDYEGWIASLLSWRWLRWTGSISYGLYVFHPLCFDLVGRVSGGLGSLAEVALSFSVVFLVASASFYLFESPILRLKDRFGYSRPSVPREASALRPA